MITGRITHAPRQYAVLPNQKNKTNPTRSPLESESIRETGSTLNLLEFFVPDVVLL